MATPPPAYDAVVPESWSIVEDKKTSPDSVPRWNIREVVSSSRTQNVASIVEQLLPQIKAQAERGHSNSELVLIPSDEDNARDGGIVGFDTNVGPPLIIQFEGQQNTTAFWSQAAVIAEMKKQLEGALISPERVESSAAVPPIVQPVVQQKPKRTLSWFSRSISKEQAVQPAVEPPRPPPVTIEVSWDDLHARKMNEYGLYETKRAGAVFIKIHPRRSVKSW